MEQQEPARRGRPPRVEDRPLVPRSLRVPTVEWDYLRTLAEVRGVSVWELIEEMLPMYEAAHPDVVDRTKKLLELKEMPVPARLKDGAGV